MSKMLPKMLVSAMLTRIVLDTNVFVSACLSGGAANHVVRACLQGRVLPLMGSALLAEYEDVLGREALMSGSVLSAAERSDLLDAFLGMSEWTRVYFGWRPNLPDEADNHLVELAVAGSAQYVVTRNLRDVARGELRFPGLKVVDATTFLEELGPWLP
jgi:putative PIN family toxin of toxin-antitoxin system